MSLLGDWWVRTTNQYVLDSDGWYRPYNQATAPVINPAYIGATTSQPINQSTYILDTSGVYRPAGGFTDMESLARNTSFAERVGYVLSAPVKAAGTAAGTAIGDTLGTTPFFAGFGSGAIVLLILLVYLFGSKK